MGRAQTRSLWSPGRGVCGALGWRRYRACEGSFQAAKALPHQHPRLSSHLALGLAGALMGSLKKPVLRWSPSLNQNHLGTPRKNPVDLGLPTWLCSK